MAGWGWQFCFLNKRIIIPPICYEVSSSELLLSSAVVSHHCVRTAQPCAELFSCPGRLQALVEVIEADEFCFLADTCSPAGA